MLLIQILLKSKSHVIVDVTAREVFSFHCSGVKYMDQGSNDVEINHCRRRMDSEVEYSMSEWMHQERIKRKLSLRDNGYVPFEISETDSIVRRFSSQVSRYTSKPAVIADGESISYQTIDLLSGAISEIVRQHRKDVRVPVAILISNYCSFVCAALGVLRAGGFYTPIDPAFPEARNAMILRVCQAEIILTEEATRALAERVATTEQSIVCVDGIQGSECGTKDDVEPSRKAYVVFTSGTTGTPKGVVHTHSTVLQVAKRYTNSLYIGSRDRLSLLSSCSVTASVAPLFSAILNGSTLCGLPVRRKGLVELARWLEEEKVTVYHSVPSLFRHLMESVSEERVFESIEVVRLGGDTVYQGDFELFKRHCRADAVLVNSYGCSEMSSVARFYMDQTSTVAERVIPVGFPMIGVEIMVEREGDGATIVGQNELIGASAPGEILLKSRYLSPGYWDDAEATRASFSIASGDSGERIYRTGDLGAVRDVGGLVHLGRVDRQVKLAGFRVEIAEIEACLREYPATRDAAVIARAAIHGESEVIGFVEAAAEDTDYARNIRVHALAHLPSHMVPSNIAVVSKLPRTPNGKIDRSALLSVAAGLQQTRVRAAASTPTETALVEMWQQILHLPEIGVDDDFYEMGGSSLLGMKLGVKVSRHFRLQVPIITILNNPTIRQMARLVELLLDEPENARLNPEKTAVPSSRIPAEAGEVTPGMLSLVSLETAHIERVVTAIPGGAANIQDIYPLTPLQEGILFHHVANEQHDVYLLSTLLAISSRKKLDQLVSALQTVIDRHDILRTAVLWEHLPEPVQVVCRQATLAVERLNVEADADPITEFDAQMKSAHRRLDVRQAPLVRLQVALDPRAERWYALLQIHHLVADHIAMEILVSEAVSIMEHGGAQGLPQPIPYRNYVALTRIRSYEGNAEAFFREKLRGIDSPIAPFGLLEVSDATSGIDEERHFLDGALVQGVRTQARQFKVSAAMIFHAAWALVVSCTSAREDVVFGTVLLGRLQADAEAERAVGIFINTLPLRLRLENATVAELVRQTRAELHELLRYEHVSLALSQRCSEVAGAAPLFGSLLNYRHGSLNFQRKWGGATGIEVVARFARTNYPITLSIDDVGDGFVLTAQTDGRVAANRIVQLMCKAVSSLVNTLRHAPQTSVLQLDILPAGERRRLVDEFTATGLEYDCESSLNEMFEEQARCTPDVTAVMYDGDCLTYADLDRRANQLARYMLELGVGPDSLVALFVERSLEMVIGLLGILKAGCAYVPVDPNYPPERFAFMLADANPRVILTLGRLRGVLPPFAGVVIDLDSGWSDISRRNEERLDVHLTQDGKKRLAYVIYTSGSTGQPKGTAMSHGPLVNLIEWHRRNLPCQGQRVLQFAALSFDVAFQEVFSTLCGGGTLVLLHESVRRDPRALAEFLHRESIERLFLPPVVLQSLAEYFSAAGGAELSLRDVITAGEQLRISNEISKLFAMLGACRLHNHYGPTETHVVTTLTLGGAPDTWVTLPSIGKPISNIKIYLLNRRRQLVPVGVPAQIYIGGVGVARGYLGRPELTAQRFIADPMSYEPGARLYDTGDVGRYLADGTLEYLGRNDEQVKIRGFRIELGEIEAQLSRHKQVKEAVVVAREDFPGEKYLVAYVTQRGDGGLIADDLRGGLAAVLPDYMIPHAFVLLDDFPSTPSGKLDRRALPRPELIASIGREYEAPKGEVEQALAAVWRDVLRAERVGRNDNFFQLGGHSLTVMRLIVKVVECLATPITVQMIFRNPTLAGMAVIIEQLRSARTAASDEVVDELVI